MKRIQLFRIGASVLVAAALVLASCGGKGSGGGSGDSASGGGASQGAGGGTKAEEKAAADLLAVIDGGDVEAIRKALSTANAAVWSTLARVSGAPGGDFSYELYEENGIIINKYSGKGGVVVIPATIEDIPVVRIATDAFAGTYIDYNQQKGGQGDMITSVIFPAGVQFISFSAFRACKQLTSVILPDTLKTIWFNAFRDCSNLHTVNIPAGVEIYGNAFDGCGNLYNLTLPEGELKFNDSDQFRGCQKLKLTTRQKLKDLGYGGKI